MNPSAFVYGQVLLRHPDNPRLVLLYDGVMSVPAFITGDPTLVRESLFYNVYKQNGMFMLGNQIPINGDFKPSRDA